MAHKIDVSRLAPLRRPSKANVVRVSVPASAYFDLDEFQAVQKDILGELGCLACTSGWDIRWDLQREFIIGAS